MKRTQDTKTRRIRRVRERLQYLFRQLGRISAQHIDASTSGHSADIGAPRTRLVGLWTTPLGTVE